MKMICTLLTLAAFFASPTFAADVIRPNILFILVDDQSPFDLKCYNPQSPLETPHIDRLAREGMVFDGAYHMGSFSGAVCTPSRHMIMSGRTVWHLPIAPQAMQKRLCPPNLEQQTIPAAFNRAGYATMRTCKQGNSYEAANKLFIVRHDATKRGGTPETGSAWHGDRVLDYLAQRESAKETKPFLIYFGFSHPHDKRDGTPELLAKYGAVNHTDKSAPPFANAKLPKLPPNYLPAHPFHHGHPGLRDEVAVSGVWERRDERTIRNELGREFACSENIDIQIGRVLAKLIETGELANTYIIYTADHGKGAGGLKRQSLFWHFPGYLDSPVQRGRDPVFRTRPVSVIRRGDFKLHLYHEEWQLDGGREKLSTNRAVELYDLAADPGEHHDLAATKTKERDELLDELLAWMKQTKAVLPQTTNPAYDPKASGKDGKAKGKGK